MIQPTIPPIEIDGINYDVEFREADDAFILMSPIQDVEIPAHELISNAITKHQYDLGDGELQYDDSNIQQEIEENAERFIRKNFKTGNVFIH